MRVSARSRLASIGIALLGSKGPALRTMPVSARSRLASIGVALQGSRGSALRTDEIADAVAPERSGRAAVSARTRLASIDVELLGTEGSALRTNACERSDPPVCGRYAEELAPRP